MALDAATANEMIQKLVEDKTTYIDTLARAHDVLAKALEAAATGKEPPKLTPEIVRRNTETISEYESVKKSSTFSPEDSDTDDNESMFVQVPLPRETYDEEGLRKHIQEYDWTSFDRDMLQNVLDNDQLLKRSCIFPVTIGPVDDRSHLSHYSIFDVGNDGAPLEIRRADQKPVSRAQDIWRNIKSINADPDRQRQAVGRITIVREPSPLLFAALHYTQNSHFDVDEIFKLLVQDKTRGFPHRPFSTDHKQQRTFVFTLDFFTVIGDECVPAKWQASDEDRGTSETHVPLTRCSSVVGLSLSGQPTRQVKNKARRAERKTGNIYDPFSPWRVLSMQYYADWKHSIDAHNSTRHYVNGPEAFLVTLRAEFKDAQKRLTEVYNRISDLVRMPPNFMFNRDVRDRLLFEDDDFTFSRRYFWAHQSLGIMNEDIQEMVLSYKNCFTDPVWDGSSKLIWPGDESASSRYANWRKRMKVIRVDIEEEIRGLERIAEMNNEKMKEIKNLRDNLFSGTSVLESRRSVQQAMITVQQGHNIRLLTLVTIFFLPLMFVTSVFGMTNMDPDDSFRPFGIATACICLPTYLLIGTLNTHSGLQFWKSKLKAFFSFLGHFFGKCLSPFGYRSSPSVSVVDNGIKPLSKRSQSAREGMAARDNVSGPLTLSTHAADGSRLGQSPTGTMEKDFVPRTLTSQTTVRFDDHAAHGPMSLIKKLEKGDHIRTDTWPNGSSLDRRPTFLHGNMESSPTTVQRRDTYTSTDDEAGFFSRALSWTSSKKKGKKGSKGEC
ncbi:MAG: hypothetical protein LQ342_004750 [Letrouitia transgressa]|nr:MAG: hypothetical protein LQ342_004750 [Letrouitia transgressa]